MSPKDDGEQDAWKRKVQKGNPSSNQSPKTGNFESREPGTGKFIQRNSRTGKIISPNPAAGKKKKPGRENEDKIK